MGLFVRVNALRMAAKASPFQSPIVIVVSEMKECRSEERWYSWCDVFWLVSLRVSKKGIGH